MFINFEHICSISNYLDFLFDDNDIQVVEEYINLRVEDDDHPETEIEIATKLHSQGLVDPEV